MILPPPAGALQETAHAKVNLFLHVTGRRDDGYHLLDSLAVFAGAADRIAASPSPDLQLSLSGPFAAGLQASGQADHDDNLVLRAARALAAEHPDHGRSGLPGVHLTLEKHLPVASGIGGGSADAAAALRLLGRFWSFDAADDGRLHAIAAGLGADVPVCLAQRPARMQGVGDILHEAPALPPLGMVLVNCGQAVATAAVFRARGTGFSKQAELPRGWSDTRSLAASLTTLSNDLETAACHICPDIGAVLAALRVLPGCLFARMSGSGATCFGLFDDERAAHLALAEAALPARWWAWAGGLHRQGG